MSKKVAPLSFTAEAIYHFMVWKDCPLTLADIPKNYYAHPSEMRALRNRGLITAEKVGKVLVYTTVKEAYTRFIIDYIVKRD